jgi:hypothetical protein
LLRPLLIPVAITAAVLATAAVSASAAPHLVYLDFAEGTEAVVQAAADDAPAGRSQLCGAARVGRWLGADGCGDRASCARTIVQRTAALWAPFDIAFTTTRPDRGPYSTVLIAPRSGGCAFGTVSGVAPVDCGDRNPSNLAFAFDCADTAAACARLISHELAHTFGLAHVDRPCDIMGTDSPSCPEPAFHDEDSRVHEDTSCGPPVQNSYRALLAVLGPAPAVAGCAFGGRPTLPWPLLLVAALLGRRCRGHRRRRGRA